MSELGQQLREARLQKGMSLDDVQEMTKIRKRYLEAIEAGDYKVLPGSFYVRAFIKTYAETVGLDPDELLEGHKSDVPSEPSAVTEPVMQKRSSSRHTREGNVKWLSTVLMWTFPILIVAVIYWYASSNNADPNENKVDQNNVTDNLVDPSTVPDEDIAVTDPSGSGGEDTEEQPPAESEAEPEVEQEPEEVPITLTESGKRGNVTIIQVQASPGTKVPVEIKASGASWLEVYRGSDSSGEKLEFGTTAAGDLMTHELDEQGMLVKSGYSPATEISVAGQVVTDGKTTTRIQLELVSSQSGTEGTTGTSTNTDTTTDTTKDSTITTDTTTP